MKFTAIIFLLFLGLSACSGQKSAPPASETPAVIITGNAAIEGVVKFSGPAPKQPENPAFHSVECKASKRDPNQFVLRTTKGKLANVFVYIQDGLPKGKYPTSLTPVVLDQASCAYVPRVFGVQVNQKVEIRNSDETLHNIHAQPKASAPFNLGMPVSGMKLERSFDQPEIMVPIKCDVHAWMRAYVGVMEHPYFATTGEDGAYTIQGLPSGTYTVVAWHEKLGTKSERVVLSTTEKKKLNFSF